MYRSLERCEDDFLLRAVCMDEESRALLARLALPRLEIVDMGEIERADPALAAVRPTRSAREYCWTATPAACRFLLDRDPEIEVITYLDADLHFSSSPAPLFAELAGDSIMIIPHRTPDDGTRVTGIYNVGWVSFRNDDAGRGAAGWWRQRCLEWCFDRIEPDRFGDQKYLDDWPERFEAVRVCANDAAGLAPWNEERYTLSADGTGLVHVDGVPLIFYHHAGLRVYRGEAPSARLARGFPRFVLNRTPVRLLWSTTLRLPRPAVIELIWKPYVRALAHAVEELRAVGADRTLGMRPTVFRIALVRSAQTLLPARIRRVYRRMPFGLGSRLRRALSAR